MSEIVISLKNVKKFYGDVKAVNGANLDVEKGSFLMILGPSGSGKSTLLYLIGGLTRPISGDVMVDNENISNYTERELNIYRNKKIGFIFQMYYLIPELDVLDNVLLPLRIAYSRITGEEIDTAIRLLKRLRMGEKIRCLPFTLSGGEQQRVAIARALITKPSVILADEPTGNLDRENGEHIYALLKELNEDLDITTILVTHDEHITDLFPNIVHMIDGKIFNHR